MLCLHDLVDHAARVAPDREAVVFGDRRQTYDDLAKATGRLAAALGARGVSPGDRVAFWATNRGEFAEFLFATSRLGAIAVPLDHWLTTEGALRSVERCRPRVVICSGERAQALAPEAHRLRSGGATVLVDLDGPAPSGWESYARLLEDSSTSSPAAQVGSDAPALLLFTSGSTGTPKGAVHSHRDLVHTAFIMALELGLQEGERTLHFLPLFSSCLEHLLPLTLVRATHVVLPRFDAELVWETVVDEGITHFDAVPTTLTRLMQVAPARCPESLRLVSYASEPMPTELIRRLVEYAPGTAFVQFYGMIEHLCLTVLGPDDQVSRSRTVGRPMLGTSIRIVDPDGAECLPGHPGEVVATSPTLMQGYWEDPGATGEVIVDGWMRTGDLGHIDDAGFLVLDGRLKEVIKTGGLSVVPRESEEALREHEAVLEAAVIGVPSEKWGEEVQAVVVLRPGFAPDESALLEHCHALLAAYKCPKRIRFADDLPRTGIGKVSRRRLVERYGSATPTEVT